MSDRPLSDAAAAFRAQLLEAQANPPPEVEVAPDGIVFQSLDFSNVADPEVLVDDLVYTEGVHLFSGHPGCGKTTIVQHISHMHMAGGGNVAWLDWEGGARPTARRLKALNIPEQMVHKQFHYAPWPANAEMHLGQLADEWPGCLVVLDSMSKALSSAGLNENANEEVTRWTTQVVKTCKERGLPIIIIDHVTKSGDSDYSRGAGAKLADVDVHWRVNKLVDFNRTQAGSIEIKLKKDREGFMPFGTWWKIGDGHGNLTILPTDGPVDPEADDDQPAI